MNCRRRLASDDLRTAAWLLGHSFTSSEKAIGHAALQTRAACRCKIKVNVLPSHDMPSVLSLCLKALRSMTSSLPSAYTTVPRSPNVFKLQGANVSNVFALKASDNQKHIRLVRAPERSPSFYDPQRCVDQFRLFMTFKWTVAGSEMDF